MRSSYRVQLFSFLCLLFILSTSLTAVGQKKGSEKDVAKAEEALKKAVTEKGEEKQDLLKKAEELYVKSGMALKEADGQIADALVEAKDYQGAQTYYNRSDKDTKKEGLKKIGAAYIEDAGGDSKNETKLLKKALDYYTKGGAPDEGYTKVGDYYYAKGPDDLQLALDNYEQGHAVEQLNKIAGDFYDKGPDFYGKAAMAYEKAGTPESLKKAGDINWNAKDYEKAYADYDKANYMDGIKKYADRLYDAGQVDAANAQYNKIADYYVKTKNSDGLEKLATAAFDNADYGLAAMYYEKMDDTKKAEKAHTYEALFKLDFDGALKILEGSDDQDLADAIKANKKTLDELKPITDEFDLIKSNQPYVGMDSNAVLGKKVPNEKDEANFEAYYKAYIPSVTEKVFLVATLYAKITDPTLKKVVREKFLTYGAVRHILNNETFAKKKEKNQVRTEDIYM